MSARENILAPKMHIFYTYFKPLLIVYFILSSFYLLYISNFKLPGLAGLHLSLYLFCLTGLKL